MKLFVCAYFGIVYIIVIYIVSVGTVDSELNR